MPFNLLDHPSTFLDPQYLHDASAWMEHIPFAFLLMDLARPRVVVELGTQSGVSYCAFCQGVVQLGLSAKCYAVDTWKGDVQAGQYSEQMLTSLRSYHDPRYGSFSELVQSTFDDAIGRFEDGSIDLLHIDGLHTLEAVSHDYETWKPKLSKAGIVLFHDTAKTDEGFGVIKLWAQLESEFSSFEFKHGFGLGVLAVGSDVPPVVREFLEDARHNTDSMRGVFARLGGRCRLMCALHFMVQQQRMINEWKRQIGLPIQANAENFNVAIGDPINYARYATGEVRTLANDDLQMRHLIKQMQQGK
jgi:O-antigen biosynthesis protein